MQMWIVFIGIGCVSLGVLCAGIVLNHRLVSGRREILDSLRQAQGVIRKDTMGFLPWLYIIYTVLICAVAAIALVLRSPFL